MSAGIDMSFVVGRAGPSGESPEPREPASLFRVLVLGDLSGRGSRQAGKDTPPTFMPGRIDLDSFDRVIERLSPRLQLRLPQAPEQAIGVGIGSFEDLEPDALFARLPLFAQMRELRARLVNPATFAQAAAELRAADAAGASPGAVVAPPSAAAEDDASTLQRLLGGLSSAAAPAAAPRATAEGVVDRLVRQLVAPHIVADHSAQQQPMIDALDRAIGETLRAVLHHPHFRALEGSWRAIDQFVRSVEMDGQVLLEVVDASAADLLDSLVAAEGDVARMPLAHSLAARRIHEGEEEGYALIVGLYEFGSGAAELALLAGLGRLAAGEGAAFIAAAAPDLATVDGSDAWTGVLSPATDAAALARWNALRASAVAGHIALVWPRLLGRLPYGAKQQPVAAFAFEELPGAHQHDRLPWRPAALDAAACLARAYCDAGWDLDPSAGADIEDLPAYVDRSGDAARFQAAAEFFMSDRQAQALGQVGIVPLLSHRSLPRARLGGLRSIAALAPALKGPWQP
jgi:type VI secretion system protein ImpC